MPSPLASAHIEAGRRLRTSTVQTVDRIWRSLPQYDRADVDQWLTIVVPVVEAAQRQSITITDAYLARYMDRAPVGLDAGRIISDLRAGAPTADVYERPFVTLWTALGSGATFADAFSSALNRATSTAATDVQMAMRGAANAVQAESEGIYGYQRVADPSACEFCQAVDGAYIKFADAMPLHPNCGCGLEPLAAPHRRAARLPSGVAVHRHGELGPVLTAPDQHFTRL